MNPAQIQVFKSTNWNWYTYHECIRRLQGGSTRVSLVHEKDGEGIGKYYTFGFWETITLHYPYFLGILSLVVRLQMDYWLLKLHTRLILKLFMVSI